MLAELKFVQGAVAKKDLIPALTHFRIEDGHVRSYNGKLALSTPISLDIDCKPKAVPFVKAIQRCEDTVSLSMTPAGRLGIKSGAFRAYIECVEEETPHVLPEGEEFDIDGEAMLKALKALSPFIGDDASRPWTNGVLLQDCSAYATNNVILAEYWVGSQFPIVCNIPKDAIRELLRIGEAPERAQSTENSITFHYSDGRWLRSTLLNTKWPDVGKILDVPGTLAPVDESFYTAIEAVAPFADKLGRVYFEDGTLRTNIEEGEGAIHEVHNMECKGVYQIAMLRLLNGIATSIDLTTYPKASPFMGGMMRGVIIGLRG